MIYAVVALALLVSLAFGIIYWLLGVVRELQDACIKYGDLLANHAQVLKITRQIEGLEYFVMNNKRLANIEMKLAKIYKPMVSGVAFTPDEARYNTLKVRLDNFERMSAEDYAEFRSLEEKLLKLGLINERR